MLRDFCVLTFSTILFCFPSYFASAQNKADSGEDKTSATVEKSTPVELKPLSIQAINKNKQLEVAPENLPIPSSFVLHSWFSGKGKVEPSTKLLKQSEQLIEQVGYRLKKSQTVSEFLSALSRQAMSFGQANFHSYLQESLPQTRTSQDTILIYSQGKLKRPDVFRAIVTEKSIHYFYNGLEVTRRKGEKPEDWFQRVFQRTARQPKKVSLLNWLTPELHAADEVPWAQIFASAIVLSTKIRIAPLKKILTAQALPLVDSHGLKCEGSQAKLKAGIVGQEPVYLEVQDLGSSILQSRLFTDDSKPTLLNLTHDWGTGASSLEKPHVGEEKDRYQDPNQDQDTPLTLDFHNILAMSQDPVAYPTQDKRDFIASFTGLRMCLNLHENRVLACERHQKNTKKYIKCIESEVLSTGRNGPLGHIENSLERTLVKAQLYLLMKSYQDLHDFPPYPATADPFYYRVRMSGIGIGDDPKMWQRLSIGLDAAETRDAEIIECLQSEDSEDCEHENLFSLLQKMRLKSELRETALTSIANFHDQLQNYQETSCYKSFAEDQNNLKTLHYHSEIEKSRQTGDPIVASYEYLDELQSLSNISGRCCAMEDCRQAITQLNPEPNYENVNEVKTESPIEE